MEKVIRFFKEEEGTEVVEWALILVLVIVLTIVAISLVGNRTSSAWSSAAEGLNP